MSRCPYCMTECDDTAKRCATCDAAKEATDARRSAAACSRIVGYRLEDGTDKAELYFLPGRPAQKTLNQMAELIKSGWMVAGIICSENEQVQGHGGNKAQ